MNIIGIDDLTRDELREELRRGGRFVIYQYCISVILLNFKRPSDIYFLRANEGGVGPGLKFSRLTLVFGWWGIPWGPIYTIWALAVNFGGGKDVTRKVLDSI
jgi:hypothetical protein